MPPKKRTALVGSAPVRPLPGSRRAGRPAADELRTVTLVLDPPEPGEALARRIHEIENQLPLSRPPALSEAEVAALNAPPDRHFRTVEQFAAAHGLEVVRRSRAEHHVVVRGTVDRLESIFGIALESHYHRGIVYHTHREPIHLPPELQGIVQAVIGLDQTPVAAPLATATAEPRAAHFTLTELAERYHFPTDVNGAGQRIAVIAFAGGFHQKDLDAYFGKVLHLRRPPPVSVVAVPDQMGAAPANDPFPYKRLGEFIAEMGSRRVSMADIKQEIGCDLCIAKALATFETTQDIEIAGALAPGAAIDVYFANNTLAGWRAAIHAAAGVRDPEDPAPTRADGSPAQPATIISLSWGCAEAQASGLWKTQIDLALQKARQRGITVCCASGDFGSLGVDPEGNTGYDTAANVICPASSPSALACGGTTIDTTAEVVWNNPAFKGVPMAGGGGVSGFFARPVWQAGCNVPGHRGLGACWLSDGADRLTWIGRGVPDVAANADAASGYELYVGGRAALGGGTSAAAPLWAGLIALLNQSLGNIAGRPITLGFLNAVLYRPDVATALRGITTGGNRLGGSHPQVAYFEARPGWNPCTGFGVPDGQQLLQALSRQDKPRSH